jgi:hypothetical protein
MKFVALLLALFLVACTPEQVMDQFSDAGVDLSLREATVLANFVAEQDCLPGYNSDQYVECAILDSWGAYNIPVSLDIWARIAWCESSLNPDAKNRYSSASGLYQNLATYWDSRAAAAGFPGGDIWNPRVHAFVSGHLAETGGVGHWNASGHCW